MTTNTVTNTQSATDDRRVDNEAKRTKDEKENMSPKFDTKHVARTNFSMTPFIQLAPSSLELINYESEQKQFIVPDFKHALDLINLTYCEVKDDRCFKRETTIDAYSFLFYHIFCMITHLLTNCPKRSKFSEQVRKAIAILNDNGFHPDEPVPVIETIEHWFHSIGIYVDPESSITFQTWIGSELETLHSSIPGFISKETAVFLPNIKYLIVRALYFSATSKVGIANRTEQHFRETQSISHSPANMFPLQLRANEELLPGISNLALTGHNESLMRILNRINIKNANTTLIDRLCIDAELLSHLSHHVKRAVVKFPHIMIQFSKQKSSGSFLSPIVEIYNSSDDHLDEIHPLLPPPSNNNPQVNNQSADEGQPPQPAATVDPVRSPQYVPFLINHRIDPDSLTYSVIAHSKITNGDIMKNAIMSPSRLTSKHAELFTNIDSNDVQAQYLKRSPTYATRSIVRNEVLTKFTVYN